MSKADPMRSDTPSGGKSKKRLCTAHRRKSGKPCGAYAVIGSTVCRMHGASSPQAKRTAQQRLLELREPAIAALNQVLRNPETDDTTKVRAATVILDRTGMGPSSHVAVEEVKPYERVMMRAAGFDLPKGTSSADAEERMLAQAQREIRKLKKANRKLRREKSIPGEVLRVDPVDAPEPRRQPPRALGASADYVSATEAAGWETRMRTPAPLSDFVEARAATARKARIRSR